MTELDALIVGAGFNGLYQLHRLRQEGFRVRLVESSSGTGGVWHSNRYPGARVDSHVPNYEYSIEAVWRDWNWTERFPGRDELVAYFAHVEKVLDLSSDIDLNTCVSSAHFDADNGRWQVETEQGRQFDARFLIMCTGFGSKPFIPDLAGLDKFEGEWYHTAHWPESGVALDDRRVAVIGTGASGVQVVQEAGKVARHLTVFQRSPVTAIPMRQRRLTAADMAEAKQNYPAVFEKRNSPPGSFYDLDRLNVGALDVSDEERAAVFEAAWLRGGFHFWVGTFNDILTNEAANRTAYDFWRDKIRARIDDPLVAQVLAPTDPPYPFGTKRPSLEQDYYETFNQSNVELVDARATPIERITPSGIRTTTTDFDFDVVVFATGFDANTGGLTAIDIRGTDAVSLADAWSDGVDTHLGISVAGFPNMLFLYGPQSSTAFCNGPTCAELQGEWVVDLLDHLRGQGHTRIESTAEMGTAWSAHLAMIADETLFGKADSWYMAANVPGKRRQLLNYPNSDGYLDALRQCAADGYDGFVLS